MVAMARVSSGLAYLERLYAAAAYAGFDGSPDSSTKDVSAKLSNDGALLLYALYQQATVGPCKIPPKPRSWSPVEQGKWKREVFEARDSEFPAWTCMPSFKTSSENDASKGGT